MSADLATSRALALLRWARMHQRHTRAIAAPTGQLFNVFQVLRIGAAEDETHSPMLRELLDPAGTHGQGAVFLRLFLARVGIADFEPETAHVSLEVYLGAVTERSGGRIDIRLCDAHGRLILIENKIYAGDQPKQVSRYGGSCPGARVLYLTLDGREPQDRPTETLQVQSIGYDAEILDWLRACHKEAAGAPSVRETLAQYIQLIEELTGQRTTGAMNKELIETITADEESLRAYFDLVEAKNSVAAALMAGLEKPLTALAAELKLERVGEPESLNQKGAGFSFTTPGLRNAGYVLRVEFDSRDFQRLFFGFLRTEKKVGSEAVARQLGAAFAQVYPATPSPSATWPAWAWWKEYTPWDGTHFEAVRSGKFLADLRVQLQKLVTIAESVCPSGKL